MTRKKIYVCAPYSGSIEVQLRNAALTRKRCRMLYDQGYHPIAPQLYYPIFLDENIPHERQDGLDAGLEWLSLCDEVRVFGTVITAGMRREIEYAAAHGISTRYVPE